MNADFELQYWPFPVLPPNQRTPLHQAQVSFCERAAEAGLRPYAFFDTGGFGAEAPDGRSGDIVCRGPGNTRWEVILYTPGHAERVLSEMVSDFAVAADLLLRWLQGCRRG